MPDINIRFDVDANGLVGSIGTFGSRFTFVGESQGGAQFVASIKPFSVAATGSTGSVGVANLVMARGIFSIEASGSQDENGRANLVAPLFRSVFGVYRDTAPLFTLRGIGGDEVVALVHQAYAVNTKNAALTEYTNFPFNHLVRFNGETIAFTDANAYLLGADDDDGTEIDASYELPPNDFGSSKMKRMPYIYVGGKTVAHLKVSAIADEATVVASKTATIGRTRRAKMARGTKGRFWAGKIQNTGGEHFAVDSVEYLPMILERNV